MKILTKRGQLSHVAAILSFLFCFNLNAHGASVGDAEMSWSAFQCSKFADMSGDKEEQKRLFSIGYDYGHKFTNEVRRNSLSEEQLEDVPMMMLFISNGPTQEFVVGRIFQSAYDIASRTVMAQDYYGKNLSIDEWFTGDGLREKAGWHYHQKKCSSIR